MIFLIFLVTYEIFILIKSIVVFLKYCKDSDIYFYDQSLKNSPVIYVVICFHKEYSIFLDTIKYFNKFISDNIKVSIICGSQKDYNFAQKNMKEYNSQISVILDTSHESTKTTKLNYFLDSIGESSGSYLAVYDFDSRPHHKTFNWVLNVLNNSKKKHQVFQQIPLSIYPVNNNIFVKNYFIQHLRRNLAIEGRNILFKEGNVRYLSGSGMIIETDLLKKIGGFPKFSDDIELGIRMINLGIRETIIPFYTINNMVPNIKKLKEQLYRIFFGYFSNIRLLFSVKFPNIVYLMLDLFRDLFVILFATLGIVWSIISNNYLWLIIYLAVMIFVNSLYYILSRKIHRISTHNVFSIKQFVKIFLENILLILFYYSIRSICLIQVLVNRGNIENLFKQSSGEEKE